MHKKEYLRISNKGTVHRLMLTLFGATDKSEKVNDPSVAGFMGTGSKFALIAAARNGIDHCISSSDEFGRYSLICRFEDIVFGGKTHKRLFHDVWSSVDDSSPLVLLSEPSGSVDAAFSGWNDPIGADTNTMFKILREPLMNARDTKTCRLERWVTQTCIAPEGKTYAFIERNDDLDAIFERPHRYFKFLDEKLKPVYQNEQLGKIYPRSEPMLPDGNGGTVPGKLRLFVQDVLVECEEDDQGALFDYSIDCNKKLVSEERLLKDRSAYLAAVALLLADCRSEEIVAHVVRGMLAGRGAFEIYALKRVARLADSSQEVWLKAVHEELGENIAVSSKNAQVDRNCAEVFGVRIVAEDNADFGQFLQKVGVESVTDMLRRPRKVVGVSCGQLTQESQDMLIREHERLSRHRPVRAAYPVGLYWEKDPGGRRKSVGLANMDGRTQPINLVAVVPEGDKYRFPSNDRDLYAALLHEGRHHQENNPNHDDRFVDAGDRDAADIAHDWVPEDMRPQYKLVLASPAEVEEALNQE